MSTPYHAKYWAQSLIDHPLAQEIVAASVKHETPIAEITFEYAPHASALERYLGTAGWLEVTKLTADAVGRSEEFLLVATCDADGKAVAPDVATKLFSLRGRVSGTPKDSPPSVLAEIRDELQGARMTELQARNVEFFREEEEKLDRWAEDVKFALERELREIDAAIKAAKKSFKGAVALAEKLEAQKTIKALEQKRTTKRRSLFDAQDDVDRKRAELIEEIERQLATKTEHERVFTIRWVLAPAVQA